jgi:putative aldouronate transport system permease protein
MLIVAKWNDWYTALIYIRKSSLFSLQYLLQKILREVDFITKLAEEGQAGNLLNGYTMPKESLRYAMAIIASGPMIMVFPFFQKYFTKGLTIGAIKG